MREILWAGSPSRRAPPLGVGGSGAVGSCRVQRRVRNLGGDGGGVRAMSEPASCHAACDIVRCTAPSAALSLCNSETCQEESSSSPTDQASDYFFRPIPRGDAPTSFLIRLSDDFGPHILQGPRSLYWQFGLVTGVKFALPLPHGMMVM